MAALTRPSTATYEIHESVQVDTEDNEDHTFCGIVFPVKAHKYLPVERIEIHSVAVRGKLGDITVWVSKDTDAVVEDTTTTTSPHFRMHPDNWDKIYEKKHKASTRNYTALDLDTAIALRPGQVRMIYVHSAAQGDEAIVYDNSDFHRNVRYSDNFLSIYRGKAHLSPSPFGQVPIWGWGNAWRDRREFVGQLQYGVTFQLWNPETHNKFGGSFNQAVQTMLLLQRTGDCPVSRLPDECLYYIMNCCKWDWFADDGDHLKTKYRTKKSQARALENRHNRESDDTTMEDAEEDDEPPVDHFVQDDVQMEETDDDDDDDDSHFDAPRHPLIFEVDIASSDEEEERDTQVNELPRGHWFRHHFARLHVLRQFNHYLDNSDDDDDDEDWAPPN